MRKIVLNIQVFDHEKNCFIDNNLKKVLIKLEIFLWL